LIEFWEKAKRATGYSAAFGRNRRPGFNCRLPIADRKSGVATPSNVRQQPTIGNSSHPGRSDDRKNSSQETKKFGTSATGGGARWQ
jgi:hypothetical protein